MFRRDACRWFGAVVLVALTACGPWGDRALGAEVDGRHYYASCRTTVPAERLGESVEDGFAIHLPKDVCAKRAKWVLLFNRDLPSDRIDELVGTFSRGD